MQLCYADGQKIAKKLSVQISKETKNIKALLPVYNACQLVIGGGISVSMNEALDPFALSTVLHSKSSICKSKRELIDSYIMVKRSSEDILMLDIEMKNTIQYYENRKKTLLQLIASLSLREDPFGKGAVALLRKLCIEVDKQISECSELFAITDSGWPLIINQDESDSDLDSYSDESDDDV